MTELPKILHAIYGYIFLPVWSLPRRIERDRPALAKPRRMHIDSVQHFRQGIVVLKVFPKFHHRSMAHDVVEDDDAADRHKRI